MGVQKVIDIKHLTNQIKAESISLGFNAFGVAKCEKVEDIYMKRYRRWLSQSMHGTMGYMENNIELRENPCLLLDNCKSIIMVALNYYPQKTQPDNLPRFSYYAYGRDYHKVVKKKLEKLFDFVQGIYPRDVKGRFFSDSAPIMERYWAKKAGLGWIGKNGMLIIPKMGSFFFLGTLLLDIELEYNKEIDSMCGQCTKCIKGCPTNAIVSPFIIDSKRCISYLTIESKDDIPKELSSLLGKNIYGCDICQMVCPWNRFSKPTDIQDFEYRCSYLELSMDEIDNMDEEKFDEISKGSAIRRAGLEKLKKTISSIKDNR